MKTIKTALALLVFTLSLTFVNAQSIDSEKSTVDFTVNNFGVGVEGTLSGLTGNVKFDAANLAISSFDVKIPVKTVNTDTEKRDLSLLGEDFFHADVHPNIEFVSNTVTNTDGGFVASGKLTMKGVTKDETITFKLENGALVGRIELDRQGYKVGGSGMLDTIGDEVVINIRCILR
ncbi:MAG: polyisoprenoid-binding protein YceI [Flavobacteriales bacterium]|jgi:polyisoprenoid-binding protein YceI